MNLFVIKRGNKTTFDRQSEFSMVQCVTDTSCFCVLVNPLSCGCIQFLTVRRKR